MRFNLSEWALRSRGLVLYAIVVFALIGAWSYQRLGQSEDPPFTFKMMVVRTLWPGATADEVARQVTDRIEKKLHGDRPVRVHPLVLAPGRIADHLRRARLDACRRSCRRSGTRCARRSATSARRCRRAWSGPFFNDEFGDTFGNIYALTGEGFDYAVLKDYAERIELELQRVPDVGKVELLGLQDEKVFIELSNTKLATLGVPLTAVQQRARPAERDRAGELLRDADRPRAAARRPAAFDSVEEIRDFPIRVGDRTFRLGDVATVRRGFSDPPAPRMRFMGEDAIGIAVAMKNGGDILRLGDTLRHASSRACRRRCRSAWSCARSATSRARCETSVDEFVRVLAEAVAIVLLVSFFSLGLRTGLVVALSIPLVLAMTFAAMQYFGIGLHKISLGALVLALGLLVDDAIIAVEMMVVKMEQGFDRVKAAASPTTCTAFPMLTGTLVTAAGFLPIATAASSTGEYTRSIFQVVTIALLLSWIAAVVFIPYLGDKLLPDFGHARKAPPPRSLAGRALALRAWFAAKLPSAALREWAAPKDHSHDHAHDPYQTAFYQRFRSVVGWCVAHRKTVIAVTVAMFVVAVMLFRFVPQQFFPARRDWS